WYARCLLIRTERSGSPASDQYRRAILVAVSIESEPPLVKNTTEPSTGEMEATRSASARAGEFVRSWNVEYASSSRICAETASAISGRPWPMLQYQSEAVASRYRRPSESQMW